MENQKLTNETNPKPENQINYETWVQYSTEKPNKINIPNEISTAIHNYKASAQRLMYYMASQDVQYRDGHETTSGYFYRVSFSEIKSICGITRAREKQILKNGKIITKNRSEDDLVFSVIEELTTKMVVNLKGLQGEVITYRGGAIIYSLEYVCERYIDLYIPEILIPLWQRLKSYTKTEWNVISSLRSGYALRLYVLLLQFNERGKQKKWTHSIQIEWLRQHFAIEETQYINRGSFIRTVIEEPIKQMNEICGFTTRFELQKAKQKGNPIKSVIFFMEMKSQIKPKQITKQKPEPEETLTPEQLQEKLSFFTNKP